MRATLLALCALVAIGAIAFGVEANRRAASADRLTAADHSVMQSAFQDANARAAAASSKLGRADKALADAQLCIGHMEGAMLALLRHRQSGILRAARQMGAVRSACHTALKGVRRPFIGRFLRRANGRA